eukprot:Sdes_comp20123_c0_seq1m13167
MFETGSEEMTLPAMEECYDPQTDQRIQVSFIQNLIETYPLNRSGGPDGVSCPTLKALAGSPSFLWCVRELFGTCVRFGIVPSEWSHCTLHMLRKDPSQPFADKARPISLSWLLRRIFEKTLLKIWTEDRETWMGLQPTQAGFRRGFSTLSHILLSDELSRQGKPISIFLDIKAAYDSVSWRLLDLKLLDRGMPPATRFLLRNLVMKPAKLSPSVDHIAAAEPINTERGLFQGSILSPLLFTIFINDLTSILGPDALLFADDIVIKASCHRKAERLVKQWESSNECKKLKT